MSNIKTHSYKHEHALAKMITECINSLALTMSSIIHCLGCALKSHTLQHFPNFTWQIPFSSCNVICCLLACTSPPLVHTHHWHAMRMCRPLRSPSLSQTEWEKFTLAFSFFFQVLRGSCYGDGIQRQLQQPMYRSGKSTGVVFVSVTPYVN